MTRRLKSILKIRPWRSGHLALVASQEFRRSRNAHVGYSDADHIRAAARWLAAAQDAQTDGGVSGRYRLDRGWTSSYPETTGYVIPTFIALDAELPGQGFKARAERAVRFLLSVQLRDGGFPGGEITENRTEASSFNTGQILHGLMAWHRETDDDDARAAAERAAPDTLARS